MKSWSSFLAGFFLTAVATVANALGVGEIELNSHLNQRLAAEIPLGGAEGLRADEIIVSLGNSEDFERAGVERFFYLTDLRFEVFADGRGPRVRVTSRQPVTEPYLNFIVEVLWPNGRMLKEFTLLLDPPTYEAAVSRPSSGGDSRPTLQPSAPVNEPGVAGSATEAASDAAGSTSSYSRPPGAAPPDAPTDGVLTSGQTLWGIAERYNPDASVTVSQYMLAIQRENPDAFIRENINLLKGGVRLKMPDAEAARALSAMEAASEVSRQTAEWRGQPREPAVASSEDGNADSGNVGSGSEAPELRSQIDATAAAEPAGQDVVQAAEPAPVEDGVTGRLEIVGDTGDSGNAQSPAANADVSVLQEENARLQREVQELGYQSDREKEVASSEIAVKDRQLEVKDQQLAELRRQLEEVQSELANRNGESSPDQSQPAQPWWLSTPAMLAAGLIVVLALAAGLLAARRRKSGQAPGDVAAVPDRAGYSLARAVPAVGAAIGTSSVATSSSALDGDDDTLDLLADDATGSAPELKAPPEDDADVGRASPAMQTSDVISEADIYAAYGRYPHAIGLLLGALEEDADRHDVRLKLLEVAVSANDSETFDKHVQELVDRCDDQDILLAARELEESFTGTSVERSVDSRGAEPGVSDEQSVDDDFSLDLDLDDDPIASSADRTTDDEFRLELDGYHDPDTGASRAPAVEGSSGRAVVPDAQYETVATDDVADAAPDDVLGGDLGIDFDDAELSEEQAPAGRSTQAQVDDLSLDDDLDIDDLLADLDEPESQPSIPPASVKSPALDEVRFNRADAGDVVPLLGDTDSLTDDDLLAEDEPGLEDLDDLLADLDAVEERANAPATQAGAAKQSAEILSFSRPRADGGLRDAELFADDVEDAAEDDGFDFGSAEDAADTKLDLARAYIEMGDSEGAQDILGEVLTEGNPAQRQAAQTLLDSIAS